MRVKILITILLLVSCTSGQALPNAPSSVAGHPHQWSFWTAHAALLAATVYDNEATHQGLAHHRCVEGNSDFSQHPTRGKLYAGNLAITAVLTAFDYLFYKKVAHGSQYIGATYGIVQHVKGGTEWFTEGCFQ